MLVDDGGGEGEVRWCETSGIPVNLGMQARVLELVRWMELEGAS